MKTIKTIFNSNLFKITSINSIAVIIKIASGLVTSKLLAIFVGPNGIALIGNFRNFTATLESISTLGSSNGIVKYIAENRLDKLKISKLISTIFISLIFILLVVSCSLYFFANFWNKLIFGNYSHFSFIFKVLAFIMPVYIASIVLLTLITGLGKFKKVIYINVIGNIIGVLTSLILITHYNTFGALLSIIITPSLLFFVIFCYTYKEINLLNSFSFKKFDFSFIKKLSSYSLMALITAVISPVVFIAIRNNIIFSIGLQQAGFWETITRISSYYLLFVTSILSIYYFPKLTISKNVLETKIIFYEFYKLLLPIFLIGLIIIYFLRFIIVKTLFTIEFMPVTTLFFWQLVGDFFKVCSWILAYNLLAKKHTFFYIASEIFSLLITYFFSIYFMQLFGLHGVVMAHAISYLIYLIILVFYFKKELYR